MSEQTQASRRHFLKSAAVGTTALAAGLTTMANVHAGGSDTIKIGLVGCGGRGTGAADNCLHAARNVQVVAIGDVFQFKLAGTRKHLMKVAASDEIKALGNSVDLPEERCFHGLDAYEKVINSDANYIILATPPGFRPLHIQTAVAAGKNLFAEKPVCVDGPGGRKCLAAYEDALKKKIGIGVGTQRRHQASYRETIQRIHQGEIGDIVALRAYWNGTGGLFRHRSEIQAKIDPVTELTYQLYNWHHFVWLSGDHICEQHIHNLDVCNWAMQAKLGDESHPIRAVGTGSRSPGHANRPIGDPKDVGHIFNNFAVDFEYKDGVHMFSMCRQIPGTQPNVSEAIVGAKGWSNPEGWINGQRLAGASKQDPFIQEHTDLIASIRAGKPNNELKAVAEAALTAVMGRLACYTGKLVTWDKVINSKEDTFPARLSWDMALPVPPVAVPGKTPLL